MRVNEDEARLIPAGNKEFPAALLTNQEAKVGQVTVCQKNKKQNTITGKYFRSGSKNAILYCSRHKRHIIISNIEALILKLPTKQDLSCAAT